VCPTQVDQAALTGESLPAKKFAGDVCFSGSTIKQGEKHALVYATGQQTFFGRAAALIAVRPCAWCCVCAMFVICRCLSMCFTLFSVQGCVAISHRLAWLTLSGTHCIPVLLETVYGELQPELVHDGAQGTHNVANLQKIMTRIGGVCLITIGVWCIIEMAVQFGHYKHSCKLGEGEPICRPRVCRHCCPSSKGGYPIFCILPSRFCPLRQLPTGGPAAAHSPSQT